MNNAASGGIGHKIWCIPDMYLGDSGEQQTPSHESISFFCSGNREATVTITAVFEEEFDPVIISPVVITPMKSLHFRTDRLEKWGVEIPKNQPYSVYIESTEKIVVEYARLNWIDGHIQSFGLIPYFEE